MQGNVLAAGDNLQRIELQVFHGAHGVYCTHVATPAPTRPQALFAENEPAGSIDVNRQHDDLLGKIGVQKGDGAFPRQRRRRFVIGIYPIRFKEPVTDPVVTIEGGRTTSRC